ncbi:MAG: rod-binding protein [Syntrophomonadaceae bacterium]|nr:rod-binding protein [Syntrophomonadaceae bacterium]
MNTVSSKGIFSLDSQAKINISPITKDSGKTESFIRQLENAAKEDNKGRLYSACQEFESIFLNQVFDCMRATIPRNDFTGYSFAREVFDSMLYQEYSKEISKTKSIGIAEMLFNQLNQTV